VAGDSVEAPHGRRKRSRTKARPSKRVSNLFHNLAWVAAAAIVGVPLLAGCSTW
jgi:hypothetical protein